MRNKIIRITVILLIFIAGVFCWININNKNRFEEETKIQNTNEKLESNDEEEKKENDEIKQNSKNNLLETKQDQKINNDKTTETIESATSPKDSEEAKQSNQNSKQDVKQEEKKPVSIVEPKKQEIWESLGITKDQYYNQPMYSWERVDFKSKKECIEYGNTYEPYLNGEVLYNCRDVTSLSGNYLGVMFDVEKLN